MKTITYNTGKRYLALPVCTSAPKVPLTLHAGETTWTFAAGLALPGEADYWVYFDAQYLQGRPLSLSSEASEEQTVLLDGVQYEDDFPGRDALYFEPDRPLYHFTSPRGWINDPNGLVKRGGLYHMFYQLNPFGCFGLHKGWGHCVSQNLFDWEILPPALSADENGYSISGSTLFDEENRAGFGKSAWVLAYSSRFHENPGRGQRQNLAHSPDGRIFHKYAGNPVLTDDTGPDFRDPKVFWYAPKGHFVMVVAFGRELRIYTSKNLKSWAWASVVNNAHANPKAMVWECPELMEHTIAGTDERVWVLSASFIEDRSVRFIFGSFDGEQFVPDAAAPVQRADYGKDFYAAVAWDPTGEMQGRKLWIGWMCFWPYADDCPKNEGWLNLFTVPRELVVKKKPDGIFRVCQRPAQELAGLLEKETAHAKTLLRPGKGVQLAYAAACRIRFALAAQPGARLAFNFNYSSKEQVRLTLNTTAHTLEADRSHCNRQGIGEEYTSLQFMPLGNAQQIKGTILLDKNCMEIYLDEGEHCLSVLCHAERHEGTLHIDCLEGSAQLEELQLATVRRAHWVV